MRNRTISLCILTSSVAVVFALAGSLHEAVASDNKPDDGIPVQVTMPPDKGFWFKVIVHQCLPQTAVTMHYVIDRDSGAPYKNEREKFEKSKNSYQSAWIAMEEGGFSLETLEFLDDKGKVVLAIPYNSEETTLPIRFELTKRTRSVAIAVPSEKAYGQCKISSEK